MSDVDNLGSLTDCYIIQPNGKKALAVNSGGVPLDNNTVDRTSDLIIVNFNQVHNSTTMVIDGVLDDEFIEVADATGIVVGSYIILFNPSEVRFSTFTAIGVVGTTIELDQGLDVAYPSGTFVDVAIIDLSVDGSGTRQIFGLRGTGVPPGIELTFNVTRIIFEMTTDSAVSLELFGDIAKLLHGITIRSRNERFKNIFNVKTNGEIGGTMFDWTPYAATNPVQGIDGFVARLTFTKMGAATDLPIGKDLEVHIHDNLLPITEFKIKAEGYILESSE